MQYHLSTARRSLDRFEREFAPAVRLPTHPCACRVAGTPCRQRHLVGDDERRIEADAKLADQIRVLRLLSRQLAEKFTRARARYGADVRNDFVARHADAV